MIKKSNIPHMSTVKGMKVPWYKKPSEIPMHTYNNGARIIFSNRGIKYRHEDKLSPEEKSDLWDKGYVGYTFGGTTIIAINRKRALQTLERLKHI